VPGFWEYVIAGVLVSWPPAALGFWLARRKLTTLDRKQDQQTTTLIAVTNEQTSKLVAETAKQTDYLKPGWTPPQG
jgi:hypothetical protein